MPNLGLQRRLHRYGAHRLSSNPAFKLFGWTSWAAWLSVRTLANPIGRQHPVSSLSRLWAWQAWRRTVRRGVKVRLPEGSVLECPPWSSGASACIAVGFHEYDETLFVLDFVRPGDLLVDVGANLGIYSIVAANQGARVIAFEPNPRVAAVLRENAKSNQRERIEIREEAAGDLDGVVDFGGPTDSQGRMFQSGPTSVSVHVRQLDSVLPSEDVALIKIDAEGYDDSVLRGAGEVIRRCRPVVLTEAFAGSPDTRHWLEERRYSVYSYISSERRLEKLPVSFADQCTFIAIPDERLRAVEGLLRTANRPQLRAPTVRWL
jgi:FkbM family methyltransferase